MGHKSSRFLPSTASLSPASAATPQYNPFPAPPTVEIPKSTAALAFPQSLLEFLTSSLRWILPPRVPDPALVTSPAPIWPLPRPRRISSDRGCSVPLFRPYVASVPWHGGVRGFLSQLFPRYGHYCGPNWSSGKDGGSMLWDQRPIDWIDFCCYCHDIGYDTYDQAKLLKADLAFLECLEQPRMASKGGGAPAAIIYRSMCIAGLRTVLIPYRMHLVRLQSGPSFMDVFNNFISKWSSSVNNEATKPDRNVVKPKGIF
ncbi:uncharacterized protein LOC122005889 isoform X1 [Zingiber officinale]|uniref:uncharacterized protein LOC122005889 isoform X1 n=1 Tax=Zingiber officinale TaxID=94328 RepID=UPI001C4B370C|nr:uncharacterized protein LOC122005889 isoform X1 [Zingiber officinale]